MTSILKRILIVDDESEFIETFLDFLSFEFDAKELVVDSAINGLDALDKINAHTYDLIVTDMRMPKMDGLALVKTVREGENQKNVDFIVFSGHAGEEERFSLKNYGVDTLIKKPHLPELVDQLRLKLKLAEH